jgi:hypothetical protein
MVLINNYDYTIIVSQKLVVVKNSYHGFYEPEDRREMVERSSGGLMNI